MSVILGAVAAPRIALASHEDPTIRFEQARRGPVGALAGVVLGYTGYSHRGGGTFRRREPAQQKVTVILNFGPSLRVSGPGARTVDAGSFVAPLSDTYAVTEEGSSLYGLQLDLTPLGAHMLLGVAMRDLSDLVVDLEALLGKEAPLLVERLHDASGWARRFAILDAFVLARVGEAQRPSPEVAWAWRRLSETAGRLRIGALTEELGCSRRHLTARFREQVGPAPKAVARVMRFRRAVALLESDDGIEMAEVAHGCGYYDQAHFNRDFRELAGTTPGAFRAALLPGGFGVAA